VRARSRVTWNRWTSRRGASSEGPAPLHHRSRPLQAAWRRPRACRRRRRPSSHGPSRTWCGTSPGGQERDLAAGLRDRGPGAEGGRGLGGGGQGRHVSTATSTSPTPAWRPRRRRGRAGRRSIRGRWWAGPEHAAHRTSPSRTPSTCASACPSGTSSSEPARRGAQARRHRRPPGRFELVLSDGSTHPEKGDLVFVDRAVDAQTGTDAGGGGLPQPRRRRAPGPVTPGSAWHRREEGRRSSCPSARSPSCRGSTTSRW
jgi:hypothetical protein